jgi:hypothetical protein
MVGRVGSTRKFLPRSVAVQSGKALYFGLLWGGGPFSLAVKLLAFVGGILELWRPLR